MPAAEEQIKDVAEVVHNDATQEPLLNLAPKRPNWDLKRDLEPQMKKLRGMTDRAILRLIAERVTKEQAEGGEGGSSSGKDDKLDLAAAVNRQIATEADEDA